MYSKYIFTILGISLFLLQVLSDNYKMKVVSLRDCVMPPEKYDKENIIPHTMSAYKLDRQNERIRANLSILHKFGPVYLNIRSFEMMSSNRESIVMETNQTCDDLYLGNLVKALNIKMSEHCELLPGSYVYDNINMNVVSPLMTYVWKYGRYGSYMDFRTPQGTVTCIKIIVDFYPNTVKKKGRKSE